MSFSLSNEARMGSEYHSIQGKVQDACDHYCSNITEPNSLPLGKSGTPASNYLKPGVDQITNSPVKYSRKAPAHKGEVYNTGHE